MPITPRAKCEDGICVQAAPNLECEYWGPGEGCTTHVMGYEDPQLQQSAALFRATPGMRVSAVSERLEELGVEPGDVITHIGGKSLHSLERAAVMSTQISKGTKITVIKADGGRLQIEL